jgi:hypothetical protein
MPRAETTTFGADLRRVRRINEYYFNPFCLGFVINKVLELKPRPTMQSASHALVSPDSFPNIGQILKNYNFSVRINSLFNNFFAHNVICFFNMPSFFAGDSFQTAFSRARTVGLKFCTSCKKLISLVPKFSTSVNSAVGRCSKIVFSYINRKYFSFFFKFNVRKIKDKIKKPVFTFVDKFCFFNFSYFKISFLKISNNKFTFNASVCCVERKDIAFNRLTAPTIKTVGFLIH